MCKYHEVAKVVEPKIAALRAAETELKVRWLPSCCSGQRCCLKTAGQVVGLATLDRCCSASQHLSASIMRPLDL